MQRKISVQWEQELRKIEQEARKHSSAGKVEHFEGSASEDFLLVDPRGRLSNKMQELERRRTGEVKFESIETDEEQFRVYGNTAIITGRSRVKGRHKGKRIDGAYRFTRVYVNDQGTWRIVSSHSTRIQP